MSARIYLSEIKSAIQAEQDFGFETTLSGRSYLPLIKQMKDADWRIELIYLALPNVEFSHERVKERVLAGGHSIPAKDIDRRFGKSLRNLLQEFSYAVDRTQCFMNDQDSLTLIYTHTIECSQISDKNLYALLERNSEE